MDQSLIISMKREPDINTCHCATSLAQVIIVELISQTCSAVMTRLGGGMHIESLLVILQIKSRESHWMFRRVFGFIFTAAAVY